MNYSQDRNEKRMKRYRAHGRKVQNKIIFTVLRVGVAAMLIAGLALAGAGAGFYMSIVSGAPDVRDFEFGLDFGSLDTVILDVHGNEIIRLDAGTSRTFAEWEEIPEILIFAFIAIEDERFFEHNGVDLRAMGRALYETAVHGNNQGGSTITQQLVKNMRGMFRNTIQTKLEEQHMAIQLETWLTEELGSREAAKNRILHEYLNIVSLGSGNYGVQAAAQFYFGKDVSELTLSESAVIAAITQRPYTFNPARNPDSNRGRKREVLNSMLRLGFITEEEHYYAWHDDVYARIQGVRADDTDGEIWSYFIDAVIDRLYEDLEARGFSNAAAQNLIFHGGLVIHTTLDPRIQDIVDAAFLNEELFPTNVADFELYLEYRMTIRNVDTGAIRHTRRTSTHHGVRTTTYEGFDAFVAWSMADAIAMNEELVSSLLLYQPQPQASMVIIDHNNGHVVAIAGQRGEKQTNRAFCRATTATRQPGSVFKIFAAYAPGIDMGLFTAATTFDDTPNIIWQNNQEVSWPNNHWGRQFRGYSNVRRAIEWSYNVVAVKAWNDVGAQNAFNYLLNFGFTTLNSNEAHNAAVVLGGLSHGITNLEMTAAMGAIANAGMLQQSIFYTVVYDRHGDVIIDNRNIAPTQVISADTAYILTDTMRDVMRSGTATSAALRRSIAPMDFAGKTGTTTNSRDVYFVGYTPYFTAGVWVGHDSRRDLRVQPRPDTRIWRYVMEQVHEGLEERRFERPAGFSTHAVCGVSGMLAMAACHADPRGSQVRTELFAPGTMPVTHCHIHVFVDVEAQTGLLPSPWTPADQIVRRSFIVRDRDFERVTGPDVPINDAWLEAPTRVSTLHNPMYDSDWRDYLDTQEIPGSDDIYSDIYSYSPYDLPDDYVPYVPAATSPPQMEATTTTPPQTEAVTTPPFTVPVWTGPPITWPPTD